MTALAKIISPVNKFRGRMRANPTRDWFVILSLSSVALVGIVVWSIWTFDMVTKGGVIGSSTTSSPPIFNESSLSVVQKVFADRAGEAEKYETGGYSYTDPSL